MSDDDEEALTWAGDEERGQEHPRLARTPTVGPDESTAAEPSATSSILLVAYGLLAGAYAIFTAGWVTSVLRSSTTLSNLPAEILYQLGEFLAIALPALWFTAVLWIERRPPRRLLWLLIGIPLVVPWPWVLGQ